MSDPEVGYYILVDGKPVLTDDLRAWSRFMFEGTNERFVARDAGFDGAVFGSLVTVFTGMTHAGSRHLWHTTLVTCEAGGVSSFDLLEGYDSRLEAERGHLWHRERLWPSNGGRHPVM